MIQTHRCCSSCGAINLLSAPSCLACGSSLKITVPLPPEPADVSHHAHLLPEQLFQGQYRIISQVGTGGFGAVYKAEDTQHGNRLVAIKEIGLGGLTPQQIIEATDAFNREVLLLSDLKHPHIPRIHGQYTDPEHWYLVMDFIEGETLEAYRLKAPDTCLPLEQVLDISIQLCTVLDYLHNHQPPIIYRDIKPSNIMLTPAGHLYLIDFGVARYYRSGKARDTIALGSPGFAPPEQYGKAQTTRQSDIYSLGVTIYQLLTGIDPSLAPFRFVSLHVLDQTIPGELDKLVMQMLEMEVSKRPASVALVKQELQRLAEKRKRKQLGLAQPAHLNQQSLPQVPTTITFSTQGVTSYIHRGHRDGVLAVAWSPDGQRIVSASEDATVQVWDALSGKDLFSYYNHSNVVSSVAWSPDGQRIASASYDQTVQVWNATAGPPWLRALALRLGFKYFIYEKHTSSVQAVAWSPDGKSIASAGDDNAVRVWNVPSGDVVNPYHGHSDVVQAISWSPDGHYIASASLDHTARIWNVDTKHTSFLFRASSAVVRALAWSPDGKYIALGSSDRTVQVWDVRPQRLVFTYKGHGDKVQAVVWSPDGKSIASGGSDQTVQVWRVEFQKAASQKQAAFIYRQHDGTVWAVAWSPDGQHIASASEDATVHVWQAV